ncbi:MAG: hypothetical protein AAFU85_19610 [Planctomycetota bacterium]
MNASSKTSTSPGESRPDKAGFGRTRIGSIAIAILLAVYALLQPHLNERYGLNLPGLGKNGAPATMAEKSAEQSASESGTSANEATRNRTDESDELANADRGATERASTPTLTARDKTPDSPPTASVPPAGSAPPAEKSSKSSAPTNTKQASTKTEDDADGDLLFGILREVRHDRFLSPQGIQYNPGSAEGHRLEHLRRHIKDQPKRPGKHGVFDGGMEGALATIDRAYERAKKKIKTTKRVEGDRTVYTVDMGGRVGFVGGRDGGRQRNPMARRVRIVLEGTQFITAFPL